MYSNHCDLLLQCTDILLAIVSSTTDFLINEGETPDLGLKSGADILLEKSLPDVKKVL